MRQPPLPSAQVCGLLQNPMLRMRNEDNVQCGEPAIGWKTSCAVPGLNPTSRLHGTTYPLAAGGLRPSSPTKACIASSAFHSTSRYLPAWSHAPSTRAGTFAALASRVRETAAQGRAEVLQAASGYLAACIRYSLGGASRTMRVMHGHMLVRVQMAVLAYCAPAQRDIPASCNDLLAPERLCKTALLETLLPRHIAGHCSAGQDVWEVMEVIVRPDGVAGFRAQSEVYLPNPPGCFWRGCIGGPRARGATCSGYRRTSAGRRSSLTRTGGGCRCCSRDRGAA
jgi:hypothetical protein